MDDLHLLELIILLMVVVLALTAIAEKLLIPYPILLVIGGLALAVMPGLPVVHLDPELVFLVFLPRFCGRPPTSRRFVNSVLTSGPSVCLRSAWSS